MKRGGLDAAAAAVPMASRKTFLHDKQAFRLGATKRMIIFPCLCDTVRAAGAPGSLQSGLTPPAIEIPNNPSYRAPGVSCPTTLKVAERSEEGAKEDEGAVAR